MTKKMTTLFAVIPDWVVRGGSANAVRVYAMLDRHANTDGACFPKLELLAEELQVSTDTVRRGVRELEAMGAVTREQGYRDGGGKSSNTYWLARDRDLANLQGRPSKSARRAPSKSARSNNESQNELERDSLRSSLSVQGKREAPKLVKVEGRNLGFDALCDVCGIDGDGNQSGRVVAALNGGKAIKVGIRELVWREVMAVGADSSVAPSFEHLVAQRITEQAKVYRQTMGDARMTPTALATWWTDLVVQPRAPRSTETFDHLRSLREGGASGDR